MPTDLSAKDKATKERLSQLHGDGFDKAYMKAMVNDHKKDVAEFKRESNSGSDPQVKQFATQTLPTLENHLQMAQQVESKVGGSTTSKRTGSSGAQQAPSSQPKSSGREPKRQND